jgi:hypothetical protein
VKPRITVTLPLEVFQDIVRMLQGDAPQTCHVVSWADFTARQFAETEGECDRLDCGYQEILK